MTATAGLQQWGSGTAASMDEQRVVRAEDIPSRGVPPPLAAPGAPSPAAPSPSAPWDGAPAGEEGVGAEPAAPRGFEFLLSAPLGGETEARGRGAARGDPPDGQGTASAAPGRAPFGCGSPAPRAGSAVAGIPRTGGHADPDPTRPLPWDRHSRSRSPSTATRDRGHEAPPLPRPPTSPHPPPPSPRRPLPAPRAPRRPHSAMRPSRMRAPPRIAAGTRRAPAGHGAPPPELERSRGWSRRGGAGGGDGAGGRARAGGCGARCCRRGALIPRGVSPHLTCSDASSRVQSPFAPRAVPPRPPHPAAPQLLTPPPGCSADPPRPARPCGAARTPGKGRGAAPQKRATHALRTLRGRLWGPGRGAGAAAEPHISSPPPERGLMKVMGRTGAAINS